MANLLASLVSSAGALRAYDRVLEVTQNNVSNAATPGFARQSISLRALPFAPDSGTTGGVWAGKSRTSRDPYAEAAVRDRNSGLGAYNQAVASLTALESAFGIAEGQGIPGSLTRLYESFSNWSMSPNSPTARQEVLERASAVAHSFRQTDAALRGAARDATNQLQSTVERIDAIAAELQQLNRAARQNSDLDAGLDASLHATLEELSELVDFSAVQQEDGSVTVLLGGEVPLIAGDRLSRISWFIGGDGAARILGSGGVDITGLIGGGRLGALLDIRNRVLPGMMGAAEQPGTLDRLAKAVKEQVNSILTSGYISGGATPVPGVDLFSYDESDGAAIAGTLAVTEGLEPSDLAAIDPGPPYVANGTASELAALAAPDGATGRIDNYTFIEYFGVMAGRVGRQLSEARSGREVQQSLVAQAKDLRQQISGVSFDEEAMALLQFQRAYQANAQLLKVLNELTQEMIDLMR